MENFAVGCGRIRVLNTSVKSSSIVQCSSTDSKHQRLDTRVVSTLGLHCVSLKCDRKHKLRHPVLVFDFKTKDLIGSYQILLIISQS